MNAPKRPKERQSASAAEAAERLAKIVDAAEQAAASVIDDAERKAQERLEEATEQAARIAAERLRELADQIDPPPAPEERRGKHLKPVEDAAESIEARRDRRTGSSGARLLATQMAVSGAGREEIEERLRSGFEIEDPGEILDAILGPQE
jgi:hypothetical protein